MTALLDLDRLADAKPESEPFPYVIVPGFLRAERLADLIQDFPRVETPRNHAVSGCRYGPAFERLLEELEGPELPQLLGQKLGVPELEALPCDVTVRARCEPSDGHVHTDHWSKVTTALLYPNDVWSAAGGRLRLLRSAGDLEDYLVEVPPVGGALVAFRRTRNSFHGHAPYEGTRRVVQVSWLRRSRVARALQACARQGTHWLKRLGLHPDGPRQGAGD